MSFSTWADLDVVVSDRSLSDARDQIESGLADTSVRASITPALGDGGRRSATAGTSVRDTLDSQLEVLVDIREAIQEGNFASAGRGGTTVIGGITTGATASALAPVIGGAVGTAVQTGVQEAAKELGLASGSVIRDRRTTDLTSPRDTVVDVATDTFANLVDPAGIGETIARRFVSNSETAINSAFDGAATAAGESLRTALDPAGIGTDIARSAVADLGSFQVQEPDWLSQFTSLFGGGGGGTSVTLSQGGLGGGESFATGSTSPTVGGPDSRRPGGGLEVSVDGRGLQRDFENAISAALQTRDFERFIVNTVTEEIRSL